MQRTLYVINPNRSGIVTQGIDAALKPLRVPGGPRIECLTSEDGPPGVQTQQDVDGAVMPLVRRCVALPADCAAVIIACFSDPGLHAVREAMAPRRVPVLGISECGLLTALTLGQRFGVIAILDTSIPRHLRAYGAMGILDRFAGERAIGLQVSELTDHALTLERMIDAGRHLVQHQGADVLVMGCAGMAGFRDALQDAVGVPVVEPTQAAVSMALGRALLGW
ncbi:aspartate/glutamate racemase family protein [Achromobacter sp. GG226]|uniref:aspartate/glutamate racemase family protein n=1 Tax=Verticiella alkaliphila TaxID=2779529 RepID=UPI001C0B5F3A|nr:aspartate/glutamate racemase family protein [Verticiella sp. GG226]MBU4609584.1 aspartate/glutamate racemase family protein [Verticiella sp. GG226]